MDTVKVKMQTFPSIYKGMINCFVKTVKTDGIIRGLYAGTMPAVVANVAENSVLFTAYGGCQKVVSKILGKYIFEDGRIIHYKLILFSNSIHTKVKIKSRILVH